MIKTVSKIKIEYLFLVLTLIVIVCTSSYQFLINGCLWWECLPSRDFSVFDLNLPHYLFPDDAEIEDLHRVRNDLAEDPVIALAHWEEGAASYSIRSFSTFSKAIEEYQFQVDSNIFTGSLESREKVLNILEYRSKLADESKVRCGYVLSDFRCLYIARYQEYVIVFSSTIEPDGMPVNKYLDVLSFIDEKINSLFSSG